MRTGWLSLATASTLIAGAAIAQTEPRIFADKAKGFSIQFPADPVVAEGEYQAPVHGGTQVAVPATIYSLRKDGSEYRVTVANLSGSAANDPHALETAVEARRKREGLALDTVVSHSMTGSTTQLCGRHFGYAGPDGRLNYETLFYNADTRLFYDIYSSVAADKQAEQGAEAIHFQQSLALIADPLVPAPVKPAFPENWKLYDYPASRFSIRFPVQPTVEQGQYRTDAGVTVPATRYWARADGTLYRLTVAHLWQTDGDTADAVDQGVTVWKRQGVTLSDDAIAISHSQCGRDVAVKTPEGTEARAWIFFPSSQHRLYVVEVTQDGTAQADAENGRRFRASFAIAKPE